MIAIGCDHAGFQLKTAVIIHLEESGIEYKDFGTYSDEPADYPMYAEMVSGAVMSGECEKGILICGTGIGMSIAANKTKGIRAALCSDTYTAKQTRRHNDANILVLGGRVTGPGLAADIVDAFLGTEFSNAENYIRRINQMEKGDY